LDTIVAAVAQPDEPQDFGDAPLALVTRQIGEIGV
jgi:hypothetical protein